MLKLVTLSHTPSTEQGANSLREEYRKESDALSKNIYYALNYYMTEQEAHEAFYAQQGAEDGVMRLVE